MVYEMTSMHAVPLGGDSAPPKRCACVDGSPSLSVMHTTDSEGVRAPREERTNGALWGAFEQDGVLL
jgi:hypothetical protein